MSDLPNIIMLPGFLCDERLWKWHADQLSNQFNVFLPELRHAENLEAMIDIIKTTCQGSFHLVGFSMGGFISQVFALKYPERILSLTLLASNVGPLSPLEKKSRLEMEGLLSKSKYKGMSLKEIPRYVYPGEKLEEIGNLIVEMSRTNTSQMYLNQMRATIERRDFGTELDLAGIPVNIIAGENDRIVPVENVKEFHQEITNSTLTIVPECGHYIPLEHPDVVLQAMINFFPK